MLLGGAVSDAHWLRILSEGMPGATELQELAATLNQTQQGKPGQQKQVGDNEAWLEALDQCFAQHELEPLCELLEGLGVPHCTQPSIPEMAHTDADVPLLFPAWPLNRTCLTVDTGSNRNRDRSHCCVLLTFTYVSLSLGCQSYERASNCAPRFDSVCT
eukprot:COSAG05_NODE_191_length_14617_cov_90.240736_18_plen_159_part_00